jgi:DNA-binding transcriptional ArsR family regulator
MKATLSESANADMTNQVYYVCLTAISAVKKEEKALYKFAGEKCVTDIIISTGLLQANVSKQLKVLQSCGFLDSRAQGLLRYYSIKDYTILKICHVMCANGMSHN